MIFLLFSFELLFGLLEYFFSIVAEFIKVIFIDAINSCNLLFEMFPFCELNDYDVFLIT